MFRPKMKFTYDEVRDTTLAECQVAINAATWNTLCCVSSGNTLLACLLSEGKYDLSLSIALRHRSNNTIGELYLKVLPTVKLRYQRTDFGERK